MDLGFNRAESSLMHVDLNSCFASIEQQANPFLRGKAVAVAAYSSPNGCILAPSVEAKEYGIKTGMRVKDGKALYPNLIILSADANKYRAVHLKFRDIFQSYTNEFYPKSIDEFVLDLEGYPCLKESNIHEIGREIKKRIKAEIGDWLRVSIGIAPTRFLAKVAAGLNKPDGLDEINYKNFMDVYRKLELMDLPGINVRNELRLHKQGIRNVVQFYEAPLWKLKAAFESIAGYYWFNRLRGWEIDNVEFARRSYGNSYSIPRNLTTAKEIYPVLAKLVNKATRRMRDAGFGAYGVHLSAHFKNDGGYWHKGMKFPEPASDTREIFRRAKKLLLMSPLKYPVRTLAVSCFELVKKESLQLGLFEDTDKRARAIEAMDKTNDRWGDYVIVTANMLEAKSDVPDRIAFGNVKELEEFTKQAIEPGYLH